MPILTVHRQKGSRTERLARAVQLLTELHDEAQYWLNHRPDGYDNSDDNADRQEKVEAFKDELHEVIETIEGIEVPIFRST